MLTEGQVLEDKYRIVRVIGRGGMGVVYAGVNTRIRRQVAIKVLNVGVDVLAVRRFEKEAQAAGHIGSDHIVEVLDLGMLPTGEHFMVMEYLEGETLKQRLRRQLMTPDQAVSVFLELCDGLGAAHAAGIVHRDLKPDNVFLLRQKAGRRDFVKILDFGISKFSAIGEEQGQATRTGMVMGTPFYMSPEQVKSSHEVDQRSDIYSAGVILFQSLTGRVPFKASTFTELLFKIVYEAPPHPTAFVPHLDPAFCAIVMKAMARLPDERYQSARELRDALEAWRASTAWQAGPSAPAPQAPPDPDEDLPTEIASGSGASSRSGAVPGAGSFTPPPSLHTQQSWAPGHPGRRGARRGLVYSIALVSLALGGLGAWLVAGRASPAPEATRAAAATTSVTTAEPVEAAQPPATTEPAASASAVASASPSASARATGAHSARPSTRPPDKTPGKPAGTVSDFGY